MGKRVALRGLVEEIRGRVGEQEKSLEALKAEQNADGKSGIKTMGDLRGLAVKIVDGALDQNREIKLFREQIKTLRELIGVVGEKVDLVGKGADGLEERVVRLEVREGMWEDSLGGWVVGARALALGLGPE